MTDVLEKYCVQAGLTDRSPNAVEYCFDTLDEASEKFDRVAKQYPDQQWRIAQWDPKVHDFLVFAEHLPGHFGRPTRTVKYPEPRYHDLKGVN